MAGGGGGACPNVLSLRRGNGHTLRKRVARTELQVAGKKNADPTMRNPTGLWIAIDFKYLAVRKDFQPHKKIYLLPGKKLQYPPLRRQKGGTVLPSRENPEDST